MMMIDLVKMKNRDEFNLVIENGVTNIIDFFEIIVIVRKRKKKVFYAVMLFTINIKINIKHIWF